MQRISLFVTDMDGTALEYENGPFHSSWDVLPEIFSEDKKKLWFAIGEEYLAKGNGFYRDWFNKQVGMLEGVNVKDLENILFPIPYTKGFKEFFENLYYIKKAILSAGVSIVAEKIFLDLNFDYLISPKLEICEGKFTGRGIPFERGLDKSEELKNLCRKLDVPLSKVCYVEDSFSDIECLEIAGFPVVYEPKGILKNYVKEKKIQVIKDFRELNSLTNKNVY